jgi:phospholipid/cholesterol/gamma-HCH transport system ATP-binding protein
MGNANVDIQAQQNHTEGGTASVRPLYVLEGITKSFGREKVLENFNFQITRGQTTVVIGPSGCGKTVLLKHLNVLLRPDSGSVFFDGVRIDNLPEKDLIAVRRRCGFLFQAGALFDSQTVEQNVVFPLVQHTRYSSAKIRRMVQEKLAMVGMTGFEDRLPSQLSGGQQKRVALARAIALSPEVILYDEPTTGLDPIRSDIINDLIIKLQNELQITSVVVTHDMKSAYKIADRIVMLSKGKIIADGTAEDIRTSRDEQVCRFIEGRAKSQAGDQIENEDSNHE